MLIAALFTTTALWNQPRWTTKEQKKKMWYAYKIELFLAIKKTCSFAKEKRKEKKNLEILILRKLSQSFWDYLQFLDFIWVHETMYVYTCVYTICVYDMKVEVNVFQGSKGSNGGERDSRQEGRQQWEEYARHAIDTCVWNLKNNEKVSCIKKKPFIYQRDAMFTAQSWVVSLPSYS